MSSVQIFFILIEHWERTFNFSESENEHWFAFWWYLVRWLLPLCQTEWHNRHIPHQKYNFHYLQNSFSIIKLAAIKIIKFKKCFTRWIYISLNKLRLKYLYCLEKWIYLSIFHWSTICSPVKYRNEYFEASDRVSLEKIIINFVHGLTDSLIRISKFNSHCLKSLYINCVDIV